MAERVHDAFIDSAGRRGLGDRLGSGMKLQGQRLACAERSRRRSASSAACEMFPPCAVCAAVFPERGLHRVRTRGATEAVSNRPRRSPRSGVTRSPSASPRTAWGRCGSLHLHRSGLSPPAPRGFPGALQSQLAQRQRAGLLVFQCRDERTMHPARIAVTPINQRGERLLDPAQLADSLAHGSQLP